MTHGFRRAILTVVSFHKGRFRCSGAALFRLSAHRPEKHIGNSLLEGAQKRECGVEVCAFHVVYNSVVGNAFELVGDFFCLLEPLADAKGGPRKVAVYCPLAGLLSDGAARAVAEHDVGPLVALRISDDVVRGDRYVASLMPPYGLGRVVELDGRRVS